MSVLLITRCSLFITFCNELHSLTMIINSKNLKILHNQEEIAY